VFERLRPPKLQIIYGNQQPLLAHGSHPLPGRNRACWRMSTGFEAVSAAHANLASWAASHATGWRRLHKPNSVCGSQLFAEFARLLAEALHNVMAVTPSARFAVPTPPLPGLCSMSDRANVAP